MPATADALTLSAEHVPVDSELVQALEQAGLGEIQFTKLGALSH